MRTSRFSAIARIGIGQTAGRSAAGLAAIGAIAPWGAILGAQAALAQPVPADDGTGTRVTTDGDRFDIDGGLRSGDGANLFHSFERFGLDAGQIANFLSSPEIRNILGRVTGGDASVVDGLLRVSGGASNLYLMNPAGILFGPNARLDVPASFAATTATGIGFADDRWFDAAAAPNWADLTGDPTGFRFDGSAIGALVNGGELAVSSGESLSLLGGTVVNTGTLTAPGGTVVVAAVPGSSRVRLSQPGSVLGLEIEAIALSEVAGGTFDPLSLPELLTGGGPAAPPALVVDPDGRVRLAATGLAVPEEPGTAIASGRLSAASPDGVGGNVDLFGDRVALAAGLADASGALGGGRVRVGGDWQGQGPAPTAVLTLVDGQSRIAADALDQGDGGQIVVWADGATQFSGTLSARGGLQGGDGGAAEVSGRQDLRFRGAADLGAPQGAIGSLLLDPENILIAPLDDDFDDDLNDDLDSTIAGESDDSDFFDEFGLADGFLGADEFPGQSITIDPADLESLGGNVTLQATNAITIADGISLAFAESTSDGTDATGGTVTFEAGGPFSMDPNAAIVAPGRSLVVTAGSILVGDLLTASAEGTAGTILLTATDGSLTAGTLDASSETQPGFPIVLRAAGDIDVAELISFSASPDIASPDGTSPEPGGTIDAVSSGGSIDAGLVLAAGEGNGGTVTLSGAAGVTVGDVLAAAFGDGDGGTIALVSENGAIDTTGGTLDVSAEGSGNGGTVLLDAATGVTTGEILASAAGDGDGGAIAVTAATGAIDATGGTLDVSTESGATGTVNLTALAGDVRVGGLVAGRRDGTIAPDDPDFDDGTSGGTGDGTATESEADAAADTRVPALTVNTPATADFSQAALEPNRERLVVGSDPTLQPANLVLDSELSPFGGFRTNSGDFEATLAGSYDLTAATTTEGGDFSLTAPGDLTVSAAIATSGGDVSLTTDGNANLQAAIDTSDLGLAIGGPSPGIAGDVTVRAGENLTAGDLTARGSAAGGNIFLETPNGYIETGTLDASSGTGTGGSVTAIAAGNRLTDAELANLNAVQYVDAEGNPTDAEGNPLDAEGNPTDAGDPGGAQLQIFPDLRVSGEVRLGDVRTAGGVQGGDIEIQARARVATGELRASGGSGSGGNVTIDPENDVDVALIDAQGGPNGSGGDVLVEAQRFFRVRDTFVDREGVEASISTAGGGGSGSVLVLHGGSAQDPPLPFTVADGSVNGTAGSINTGTAIITPREEFFGPVERGNIGLITDDIEFPNGDPGDEPGDDPGSDGPIIDDPGDLDDGDGLGVDRLPEEAREEFSDEERSALEVIAVNRATGRAIARAIDNLAAFTRTLSLEEARATYNRREETFTEDYRDYLELAETGTALEFADARDVLRRIEAETGVRPALLYVRFNPAREDAPEGNPDDLMSLMLVTAEGNPVYASVPATRERATSEALRLRAELTNPLKRGTDSYLAPAQQLYDWILRPLVADLEDRNVENIAFLMDEGLRSLPVAALHDGDRFLLESFSVGLMPSLALTNTQYQNITQSPVLGLGASLFEGFDPLPAVPEELTIVTEDLRQGRALLNEAFTRDNLKTAREADPVPIVHLATHAEFRPGSPDQSFIQLWGDERIPLDEMSQLGWSDPVVELLVLSACRTAVGDPQAELGFAGLAVASGAKTALASLWYVSDTGTLGLMSEFYQQLGDAPIKAEALRQAQLALARGEARIEGGDLVGTFGRIPLPPEIAGQTDLLLSHPYFWSAFTVIGSPW